jgi:signal transduction histidine kinase
LPLVSLAEDELVQILLNLLLNAADAAPREGGRITLRAAAFEGGVRVEVEDNGPGVAPEVKDRLFEPFTTTKEVGKGTGLGLAVCRGLLEAAGGSIGSDSSDAGARFVFTVPGAGLS